MGPIPYHIFGEAIHLCTGAYVGHAQDHTSDLRRSPIAGQQRRNERTNIITNNMGTPVSTPVQQHAQASSAQEVVSFEEAVANRTQGKQVQHDGGNMALAGGEMEEEGSTSALATTAETTAAESDAAESAAALSATAESSEGNEVAISQPKEVETPFMRMVSFRRKNKASKSCTLAMGFIADKMGLPGETVSDFLKRTSELNTSKGTVDDLGGLEEAYEKSLEADYKTERERKIVRDLVKIGTVGRQVWIARKVYGHWRAAHQQEHLPDDLQTMWIWALQQTGGLESQRAFEGLATYMQGKHVAPPHRRPDLPSFGEYFEVWINSRAKAALMMWTPPEILIGFNEPSSPGAPPGAATAAPARDSRADGDRNASSPAKTPPGEQLEVREQANIETAGATPTQGSGSNQSRSTSVAVEEDAPPTAPPSNSVDGLVRNAFSQGETPPDDPSPGSNHAASTSVASGEGAPSDPPRHCEAGGNRNASSQADTLPNASVVAWAPSGSKSATAPPTTSNDPSHDDSDRSASGQANKPPDEPALGSPPLGQRPLVAEQDDDSSCLVTPPGNLEAPVTPLEAESSKKRKSSEITAAASPVARKKGTVAESAVATYMGTGDRLLAEDLAKKVPFTPLLEHGTGMLRREQPSSADPSGYKQPRSADPSGQMFRDGQDARETSQTRRHHFDSPRVSSRLKNSQSPRKQPNRKRNASTRSEELFKSLKTVDRTDLVLLGDDSAASSPRGVGRRGSKDPKLNQRETTPSTVKRTRKNGGVNGDTARGQESRAVVKQVEPERASRESIDASQAPKDVSEDPNSTSGDELVVDCVAKATSPLFEGEQGSDEAELREGGNTQQTDAVERDIVCGRNSDSKADQESKSRGSFDQAVQGSEDDHNTASGDHLTNDRVATPTAPPTVLKGEQGIQKAEQMRDSVGCDAMYAQKSSPGAEQQASSGGCERNVTMPVEPVDAILISFLRPDKQVDMIEDDDFNTNAALSEVFFNSLPSMAAYGMMLHHAKLKKVVLGKIVPPLNTDEQNRIKQTFTEISREGPVEQDAKLVEFVSRKSFLSLDRDGWLNDEVINFYFRFMTTRDAELCERDSTRKPSFFFSPYFSKKLMDGGSYDYSNVKNWKRFRFREFLSHVEGGILSLDKIFVPFNIHENHWIIVVVFMQERRMVLYDCLGGSERDGELYLNVVFHFLQDFCEDTNVALPDPTSWKLYRNRTAQQKNGACLVTVTAVSFGLFSTSSQMRI
jgi:Ulp1 protease family, C-terminal catalytic domain